jgi:2-polyprenyl-6-methoxyphenol hydroxylase-like FAD-dependent oxidoreductase
VGRARFVADDPEDRAGATIDQVVDGARRLCGLLPTGHAPNSRRRCVSLFWSLRADRLDAVRAGGLDAWKAEVRGLHPRTAPVLDQIRSMDQVLFAPYRDVAMPRWHSDRIVFIGDAAHATSPQLGQGANLALWDAKVLAETLPAGLETYTRARRAHLGYYQFATRALTPLFQGDSRVIGAVRDLVFPLALRVAPIRRRMVRTMIGDDTGVLWGTLPLAGLRRAIGGPTLPGHG